MKKATQHSKKSSYNRDTNIQYFHVEKNDTLLNFLFQTFPEKSKTTVKSYLSHKQVAVNKTVCSQFDYPLQPGDSVAINFDRNFSELKHPMLKLVYEDDYFVVVNKANGLLTVATDLEKNKTAFRIVSDYVKSQHPRNHIFVLHRLDKDTSGLLVFAKSPEIQSEMQRNWERAVTDRKYVAVIEGCPEKMSGELTSYLCENKAFKVYSSSTNQGQFARTRYQIIKAGKQYSLVELELGTGRKNQIRVHMSEIGHSIAGDKKYGAQSNPIKRIALHAFKLAFIHPITKEELSFSTPIPRSFQALVK